MIEVRDLSGNSPFVAPRGLPGSPSGTMLASTLVANGTFGPVKIRGLFNAVAVGTFDGGTIDIQRSLDGGVRYDTVSRNSAGDPATYAVPFNFTMYESNPHALYQFLLSGAGASVNIRARFDATKRSGEDE